MQTKEQLAIFEEGKKFEIGLNKLYIVMMLLLEEIRYKNVLNFMRMPNLAWQKEYLI